jgi:hypothetical protein
MIFKIFKNGIFTGNRINHDDPNKTKIHELDRHISKLAADEWENDYRFTITEIKSTTFGLIIVEIRMEHFDMEESDEIDEINIWELVRDE